MKDESNGVPSAHSSGARRVSPYVELRRLLLSYLSPILVDTVLNQAMFKRRLSPHTLTNAELLQLKCTVLIPAALSEQITKHNAPKLNCRVLAEGANGPTTLEADAVFQQRGVTVVPDILANAGGVTVSYFEWVQGIQQFFWSEQEVNDRLIRLMQRASKDVWGVSRAKGVDLRSAALMRGIERVAEAKRRRGVFP